MGRPSGDALKHRILANDLVLRFENNLVLRAFCNEVLGEDTEAWELHDRPAGVSFYVGVQIEMDEKEA